MQESHTVALPFDSSAPNLSGPIYATWGSYDETTLIHYQTFPSTNGIYHVGFVPMIDPGPVTQWPEDPNELAQASVFLIKSSSLIRHFIFKYPEADPGRKRWEQETSVVANTPIDSIAVVLPPDAEGKSIRRTNRSSNPDPIYEIGITKFYPATQNAAHGATAIHVKYERSPSEDEKAVIEESVKAIILFLAPFVQFTVRKLRKADQRQGAKKLIWIFAGIWLIAFVILLYLAYTSWQESIGRAITQLFTALLSGLFTAHNLWEEKKDSASNVGAVDPAAH
jgi:hypothetical protein